MSAVALHRLKELLLSINSESAVAESVGLNGEKVVDIIDGKRIAHNRLGEWRRQIPEDLRKEMEQYWDRLLGVKLLKERKKSGFLLDESEQKHEYMRSHASGAERDKMLKYIIEEILENREMILQYVENYLRRISILRGFPGKVAIFIGGSTVLGPRKSIDTDIDLYVMAEGVPYGWWMGHITPFGGDHIIDASDSNYEIALCSERIKTGFNPFHIVLQPNICVYSEFTQADLLKIQQYQIRISSTPETKNEREKLISRILFELSLDF